MTEDGFGGYLTLALIMLLAHEPWRWLGLLLGRNLSVDSSLFIWVRAVSTALVAGLVMRLLLFPAGALADVPLAWRLLAGMAGVAAFFAAGRSLAVGVLVGAALFLSLIVIL